MRELAAAPARKAFKAGGEGTILSRRDDVATGSSIPATASQAPPPARPRGLRYPTGTASRACPETSAPTRSALRLRGATEPGAP